ncbi:TPA: site-specific integrase [Pseudomonas aeruginosa]|nr:site-specific integrase [Pseudomonas aeruginosa]
MYAIIVLALETAMRQGEILSLRWENISWQKRTVLLPLTKNGDPREVPLSKAAYDILRNHMTPLSEGGVFSCTSNGLKSSWRIFVKGLGIDDLHFHDLRHCAISSLLERGLNTIEVASISGHKSMAMLKRYSHLMTYKLVAKLDPKPRAKKDRPILRDHLRAYPAVVTEYTHRVDVDFPDFIDLRLSGKTADQAIEGAQANLLRKVVTLWDGTVPPEPSPPDTICLPTHKSRVEIISPI